MDPTIVLVVHKRLSFPHGLFLLLCKHFLNEIGLSGRNSCQNGLLRGGQDFKHIGYQPKTSCSPTWAFK
jgi:hypothetical protein